MQANVASNSYATTFFMAPYYRQYDLPWSPTLEVEQRFRKLMKRLLIAFLIMTVVMWLLPTKDRALLTPPDLPDRVVQLVIEKKLPPPPPPPPKEEAKPEPKPEETPKPVEQQPKPEPPKPDARKKAEQAVSVFDAFADLRDSAVVEKAQQTKNLTGAVGEQTRSERALLTSKVAAASGGIDTSRLSRDTGDVGLAQRGTTRVASPVATDAAHSNAAPSAGKSRQAARSIEEIQMVFDRNKSAIYGMYNRALRSNPTLQGKLVLRLTISPDGRVVDCAVISSELADADLGGKVVARVKMFDFGAKDVDVVTITYPIDFLPA